MGFCLVIIAATCAQGLIFLSFLDVHRLIMQPVRIPMYTLVAMQHVGSEVACRVLDTRAIIFDE